ncbi:MAG: serine hydrolase, partial [Bacteroidota bacterium]
FRADSLQQHLNLVNHYGKLGSIAPLICSGEGFIYPDYLSDAVKFPGSDAIACVSDDSLLEKYALQTALADSVLGISLCFSPENFSNSEQDYSFNSRMISAYDHYQRLGCLMIRNCEQMMTDTTAWRLNVTFAEKAVEEGIPVIFIDNDMLLDSVDGNVRYLSHAISEESGHEGLIIKKVNRVVQDIKTFPSGNTDMLYVDTKIIDVINHLKELFVYNKLPVEELNRRVRKILLAKSWAGLEQYNEKETDTVMYVMQGVRAKGLARKLYEAATVVIRNKGNFIPVRDLTDECMVFVFGNSAPCFADIVNYYRPVEIRSLPFTPANIKQINIGEEYGICIILLNNVPDDSLSFRLLNEQIGKYNSKVQLMTVSLGMSENLEKLENCKTLVLFSESSCVNEELAAQAVFGGYDLDGVLPVWRRSSFAGYKPAVVKKTRLGYTIPEEFGLSSDTMRYIDSIVYEGLREYAYPGCQVFIAKEGKVIFNKAYGYHSYERDQRTRWDDLYDIASVTKIAATTLATMKMVDQGKMKLDDPLEEFFKNTEIEYTKIKPDTIIRNDTANVNEIRDLKKFIDGRDTIHLNDSIFVAYDTLFLRVTPRLNIFKCKIKDLLIHKSGLPPSMPILKYIQYRGDTIIHIPDTFIAGIDSIVVFDTLKSRKDTSRYLFNKYYTTKRIGDTSRVEIARNFYLRREYEDTLWIDTKQIRVYSKNVYMYSDVNPILVQQAIDSVNGYGIDEYLEKFFYKPLGMRTTGYKPLNRFKRDRIAPTEDDKFWRGQVLQGYVHDPSAALLGGIAGNAGLFSSAHDLGILFQMILDGGTYGGVRYIRTKTIEHFTSFQPGSHRGLGFDKALEKNIVAYDASRDSYGHTGFTGCCVWVDPHEKLVYVFLSNRVHPKVKNWKLNTLEIRQRVHQVVYDAIHARVKI